MRRTLAFLILPLTMAVAGQALVGCQKGGSESKEPGGDPGMAAKPESEPGVPPAMTPDMAPDPTPPPAAKVQIDPEVLKLYGALPDSADLPDQKALEQKVALGRMLYHENRLSKNHDFSCNTCHKLDQFGVDEPTHKTSKGHKGQFGSRNSPTVYNAALHFAQFWDGREKDVEGQAKGPVMNPVEMSMPSEKVVIATLKSMPEYVKAFAEAFPGEKDAVTFDNFAKAVGAFERKLLTPSRWDKFLKGDQAALTEVEKQGFNDFQTAGCNACHAGPLLGGDKFMKLGSVKPWPETKDLGRFAVTKNEADKFMFKVMSLRNIEKTGPYLHDGGVATLEESTKLMGLHQLGKILKPEQVASIIAFLKTLTGEPPAALVPKPTLPPSTPKTPKPDPA